MKKINIIAIAIVAAITVVGITIACTKDAVDKTTEQTNMEISQKGPAALLLENEMKNCWALFESAYVHDSTHLIHACVTGNINAFDSIVGFPAHCLTNISYLALQELPSAITSLGSGWIRSWCAPCMSGNLESLCNVIRDLHNVMEGLRAYNPDIEPVFMPYIDSCTMLCCYMRQYIYAEDRARCLLTCNMTKGLEKAQQTLMALQMDDDD